MDCLAAHEISQISAPLLLVFEAGFEKTSPKGKERVHRHRTAIRFASQDLIPLVFKNTGEEVFPLFFQLLT